MKEVHENVFNFLVKLHNNNGEFLFTLRKLNRYSKLDEGFWFLGNENYLAVSFWSGNDNLTRTPRIFFQINKSGKTSLQLKNKDVSGHTDFFHPKLIHDLNLVQTNSGWEKDFGYDDYLKSLDQFLNHEKEIIDKYIKSEYNDYGVAEWSEPLDFLNTNKFLYSLNNVEKYRKKIEKGLIPNNFFLKDLSIKNFGSIKSLQIHDLTEKNNWIFLTGENGSGKTTILKAIATAICNNTDNELKISEEYNIKEFNLNFRLYDGQYYSKSYDVDKNSFYNNKFNNPIEGFAAYGAVRLLTENTIDRRLFKDVDEIRNSKVYSLFNTVGIFNDLTSDSFKFNENSETYDFAKDALVGNLELIIPNIAIVEIEKNNKLRFFEREEDIKTKQGKAFEELPSGTRNFVALILDLLIKFHSQQPDIIDPAEYKGLVLIDEIDIHLHPKMQIELVKQLSDTFPNIQFIATTHSPIPILGAPDNSVFLKVERYHEEGTCITRLYDLEENFKKLLPTALLTSELFDLEQIIHRNTEIENVNTMENYEKAKFDMELDKELGILKLKDMDTFRDFKK